MAGTRAGGIKARDKNLARNPNHYAVIGTKGGKNSNNGGFASQKKGDDGLTGPERASVVGVVGGTISRRKYERKNNG